MEGRMSIVYNSVGSMFETLVFNGDKKKKYDFVTIRSSLDGSKYGVDIVTEIARQNPESTFCVVGKGEFFFIIPARLFDLGQ